MDLSIIVPFFNEEEGVPQFVRGLIPTLETLGREYELELVLVDDGSTDSTTELLRRSIAVEQGSRIPILIERHPANIGLGAALRTGFIASTGRTVVTMDSDGSYAFSELPALLDCLTSEVDVVTASPYHPKGHVGGVSKYRLMLSRAASTLYRFLVDRRIYTYTSLFRAYRRGSLDAVGFWSSGFLAPTEILVKANLMGFRILEYPSTLRGRSTGVSNARIGAMIKAHLVFQCRLLLHRFRFRSLIPVQSSSKGSA